MPDDKFIIYENRSYIYLSPEVEEHVVRIEQGFALSGGIDDLPITTWSVSNSFDFNTDDYDFES